MPISAYSRKLAPPGDEPYARIKWQGPTSYARVATPGTGTATAGDPLPAVLLGVQEIQAIEFAGIVLRQLRSGRRARERRVVDSDVARADDGYRGRPGSDQRHGSGGRDESVRRIRDPGDYQPHDVGWDRWGLSLNSPQN